MLSEERRFVWFAFRQLRRIPLEWQPHYKGLLLNDLHQRKALSATSRDVTTRPLFWKLNNIKRGYHGVRWVLSRFDLDCPPIPEVFEDPNSTIFTNEDIQRGPGKAILKNRHLTLGDPYLQSRTMSEAESRLVNNPQQLVEFAGQLPTAPVDNSHDFLDDFSHRFVDPQDMTEQDFKYDEYESDYGGLLYSENKGYPEGMGADVAEKDPSVATWHSNTAVAHSRDTMERRALSVPLRDSDMGRWRKAVSGRGDEVVREDQGCAVSSRWVQDEGGNWVRRANVASQVAPEYTTPPPGLFGNDY